MALKALIATQGEKAASAIRKEWRVSDLDLLARVRDLVDAAVNSERERCCGIVYGECSSDNVAERTVRAIRKKQ